MILKSKTEQLNSLFKEWGKSESEYNVWDGIINEELYSKAKEKILFITKEPNKPNKEAGDFREWWKDGIKHAFSLRIAEWSYGLLYDFPEYDEIRNNRKAAHNAILQIAFMNLIKVGGGGIARYERLIEHTKKNLGFIHRQIETIDPKIIITGLSWKDLRSELFPGQEWRNSGYDIAIAKFKQAKVIDFYHPSSRTAPAAAYSLLQNIVNSEKFRKL